jgi:hypothetical protein
MATLTLTIDNNDAKLISNLATAADIHTLLERVDTTTKTISEGKDLIILTDRTRAIDQIKRLYAVIVGFSAITLLSNYVICIRTLDPAARGLEAYGILASQTISFFSLLILFLLGAERLLDTRYLQITSVVPSWYGLMGDVIGLLVTAGWFAVLANLSPVATGTSPTIQLSDLRDSQRYFVYVLLAIYVADLVFLAIQLVRFNYQKKKLANDTVASRQQDAAAKIHKKWIGLNLVMAFFLAIITIYFAKAPQQYIYPNLVSLFLIAIHFGRFWYDLAKTFTFYYPEGKLTTAPTS